MSTLLGIAWLQIGVVVWSSAPWSWEHPKLRLKWFLQFQVKSHNHANKKSWTHNGALTRPTQTTRTGHWMNQSVPTATAPTPKMDMMRPDHNSPSSSSSPSSSRPNSCNDAARHWEDMLSSVARFQICSSSSFSRGISAEGKRAYVTTVVMEKFSPFLYILVWTCCTAKVATATREEAWTTTARCQSVKWHGNEIAIFLVFFWSRTFSRIAGWYLLGSITGITWFEAV